jgi:hypothetical protein
MSETARLDKIPSFVKARTPEGLRRVMLINNIKNAMQFVYHDIQFVNGFWYAWYYEQTDFSEVVNANNNGAGEA